MGIDAVGGFEGKGGIFGKKINGSFWVEEDLLISIIPEITKDLKIKGPVFKNKQGSNDKYNEYLWAAAWGFMAFSVVSENNQSSN